MSTHPGSKRLMGAVKVTLALSNFSDEENARLGLITQSQIRRASVEALVDTGATRLVLPKSVAEALGLRLLGQVGVRFADSRKGMRDRVGIVVIEVMGRRTEVDAIVEPSRSVALLGRIPHTALDLRPDVTEQRLIPNPESPDLPLCHM